jgi:hypothetical protein
MNCEIESNFLFVFLLQLLLSAAAAKLGAGSLAHGCAYRCRQLGAFLLFFWKNYLVPVRSPGTKDVGLLSLIICPLPTGTKAPLHTSESLHPGSHVLLREGH